MKGRLAALFGRSDWVRDGRTEVPVGLAMLNFFVQRVCRVNAKCRYPVHFTSMVTAPERLELGEGVARYLAMSGGCYLQALNGLAIGDHTMIGPGVKIISADHSANSTSVWTSGPPVIIGCRCWLGANSVVLPGVTIGDGATVGAGAVVTHDVAPGQTVVGVPARPIEVVREHGFGN